MRSFRLGLVTALTVSAVVAAQQASRPAPKPAPPTTSKPTPTQPDFFTTPLTLDQMRDKQAVVETDLGTIVIDLLPEAAPNHVGYFIRLAPERRDAGAARRSEARSCRTQALRTSPQSAQSTQRRSSF